MTLAVHPRFGEKLEVLGPYGQYAVWVETADGQLRLLPRVWTSLEPRCAPLELGGRAVRLGPMELRELAAWVSARTEAGKKFATGIAESDKPEHGALSARGDDSAASVVGEARASTRGRRVEQRKRGGR